MLVYCPTPQAVIMVTITGTDGVVRCLSGDLTQPGLIFEPKPLLPIVEQIMAQLRLTMGASSDSLRFQVRGDYADEFSLANGSAATLYIATATLPAVNLAAGALDGLPGSWMPIPELLRSMERTRQRLVYLRAWQVLLGALTDETKAVDLEEAMRHLKQSPSS